MPPKRATTTTKSTKSTKTVAEPAHCLVHPERVGKTQSIQREFMKSIGHGIATQWDSIDPAEVQAFHDAARPSGAVSLDARIHYLYGLAAHTYLKLDPTNCPVKKIECMGQTFFMITRQADTIKDIENEKDLILKYANFFHASEPTATNPPTA